MTSRTEAVEQVAGSCRQAMESCGCREGIEFLGMTLEHLYAALDAPVPEVRRAAAEVIGSMRDPAAVPVLLGALKDRDAGVRMSLVAALGRIADRSIRQRLIKLLEDADFGVRNTAMSVLEQFGWVPPTDRDRALAMIAKGQLAAAATLGEPAIEPLATVLASNSPILRQEAVHALGKINDPRILELLSVALRDPDLSVRVATLNVLREIDDARILGLLAEAVNDQDCEMRITAARLLGSMGFCEGAGSAADQGCVLVQSRAQEVEF